MHPIFYFLESTPLKNKVYPTEKNYTSTMDPAVNVGLDPATNQSYCTVSLESLCPCAPNRGPTPHCHGLCLTLIRSKILLLL